MLTKVLIALSVIDIVFSFFNREIAFFVNLFMFISIIPVFVKRRPDVAKDVRVRLFAIPLLIVIVGDIFLLIVGYCNFQEFLSSLCLPLSVYMAGYTFTAMLLMANPDEDHQEKL